MNHLTPVEAAEAIRSGKWAGPARVSGRLDLTKFDGATLPGGLHCYDLDASQSKLTSLPPDLKVDSRLVLDGCTRLESLPEGLEAGSISLRGCSSLRALPEGLSTWFLDLTGCREFSAWPRRGTIHHGSLVLRDCHSLKSLPSWLGRLSNLDVAGCFQLQEIPEGISVSTWIDLAGSGVAVLPGSLAGASLRWRGVRINDRIAFHPEELTAAEALAEKNAEVRRVIIERMGYLRFTQESNAKVLDQDRDAGGVRQLLHIDLPQDEPLVGLSCCCPSTDRQYFLRVPPAMKSCHQAAAWMAGFDDPSQYHPIQET